MHQASVIRITQTDLNRYRENESNGIQAVMDWLRDHTTEPFYFLTGVGMKLVYVDDAKAQIDSYNVDCLSADDPRHAEIWLMFSNVSDATLFKLTWK